MIIFIGAAIGLFGGAIAAWGTYMSGKESAKDTKNIINTGDSTNLTVSKLKDDNEKLTSQVSILHTQSIEQIEKIHTLTTQNAELSIQLSNSTLQLSQSITGGDSFCELDFVNTADPGFCKVFVINHGKYPLHDFQARVFDLGALKEMEKTYPPPNPITGIIELPSGTKLPEFKISLGTIMPNSKKEIMQLVNVGKYGKVSSFNIFLSGKNGDFVQLLRMYKTTNSWIKASRIQNEQDSKILYEFIDNEFPKDKLKW
jgi:hypothetical protein